MERITVANRYTLLPRNTVDDQSARKAIVVSNAFCSWPAHPATTGQVLNALNHLYDRAYADGAAGRVKEGEAVLKELLEAGNG